MAKDNVFRQIVARRRFRAEQEHARYAVGLRVLADLFVQRQNMQQVKVLTFVLVQTFDLDIENRLRVDLNPGALFTNASQMNFVGQLDSAVLSGGTPRRQHIFPG